MWCLLTLITNTKMAKPIKLVEKVYGRDAINFLNEKERVESLKPNDPEYIERKEYFRECKGIAGKIKAS